MLNVLGELLSSEDDIASAGLDASLHSLEVKITDHLSLGNRASVLVTVAFSD